jgi:hypothetical protein
MRRGNDWERRFGRRRRSIDRALLEAAERAIAVEELEAFDRELDRAAAEPPPDDGARARLARAFGRPADPPIDPTTGRPANYRLVTGEWVTIAED